MNLHDETRMQCNCTIHYTKRFRKGFSDQGALQKSKWELDVCSSACRAHQMGRAAWSAAVGGVGKRAMQPCPTICDGLVSLPHWWTGSREAVCRCLVAKMQTKRHCVRVQMTNLTTQNLVLYFFSPSTRIFIFGKHALCRGSPDLQVTLSWFVSWISDASGEILHDSFNGSDEPPQRNIQAQIMHSCWCLTCCPGI